MTLGYHPNGNLKYKSDYSVVNESAGFQAAKTIAGAVSDALHNAQPALSRGRIVRMQYLRAKALRIDDGTRRRIDLLFEARVEDE